MLHIRSLRSPVTILFFVFLIVGTILRFYRLPQTMQFLGDQGRDARITRGILMEKDPALIGPGTSVGNMYLGPLYYYLMVFPLMLSYPSPVGPAIAVAFVGCITVALIFILGKQMVGEKAALVATGLYAVAPTVIENVRFSWNPNVVPFFSLLLVWSLYQTLQKQYRYWWFIGLLYAILFQLHYITLVIAAFAGIVWLYELILMIREKHVDQTFIRSTIVAIVIFILSLVPLAIYDVRHEFLNSRSFLQFFSSDQKNFQEPRSLSGIWYSFVSVAGRNFLGLFKIVIEPKFFLILVGALIYLFSRLFVFFGKPVKEIKGQQFIALCFLFSVFFLSLYQGSLFDHYLGFVFPIAVLVMGSMAVRLFENMFLRPLVAIALVFLTYAGLSHYGGGQNLDHNVFYFQEAATVIATHVNENEKYDVLLLAQNNDPQGPNYRYFLETMGKAPVVEGKENEATRLFVITEDQVTRVPQIGDQPHRKILLWKNRMPIDSFQLPKGGQVYILSK